MACTSHVTPPPRCSGPVHGAWLTCGAPPGVPHLLSHFIDPPVFLTCSHPTGQTLRQLQLPWRPAGGAQPESKTTEEETSGIMTALGQKIRFSSLRSNMNTQRKLLPDQNQNQNQRGSGLSGPGSAAAVPPAGQTGSAPD